MKKVLLLILFAILQTSLYARNCGTLSIPALGPQFGTCVGDDCSSRCGGGLTFQASGRYYYDGTYCNGNAIYLCGGGWNNSVTQAVRACATKWCSNECLIDSARGCTPPSTWNSESCSCSQPPPPPCQKYQYCETYWNTGNGMGVAIGPGIIASSDSNYSGAGYYAMRLYLVDSCKVPPEVQLVMDVPGTCTEQGFCPPGQNNCENPTGGSSSSAGSSSSYEPPDCVCLGCFGGSCMVTCSDGSNRTCRGDFDNCSELKNSPTWTECTAPSSSASGGSSSGGGGSSASPSSQDNAVDGLNALIDTLHHSNELQEVGHGIMRDGNAQNKSFFDDVRGFFGGLLAQVKGIFGNTQSIVTNTNNINKGVNNIANKLDSIKNRPRDTTIVNVEGDTINIQGDTNIINLPIDSAPGLPWDTAGAVAGARTAWDSLSRALDSLPNPDTIHTGPPDSLVRGVYGALDSGVGRIYRDTIDALVTQGIANSTLSGQGSNTCPAFIMQSYPLTIGSITIDLTQHVKLGQYLCNPVIGGKSAWDIGRTILRIVVAIGCMFFLFKCATGTLGGDD